jgi:hypothetical protein
MHVDHVSTVHRLVEMTRLYLAFFRPSHDGYGRRFPGRGICNETLAIGASHDSKRKSLRTTHRQHSHPIIRWKMTSEEAIHWRFEFVKFWKKNCDSD